jgi:hypothetical protein
LVVHNRRKETRMGLKLPTRVHGTSAEGAWEEMTSSDDASFGGVSFNLIHPVVVGHVLYVDLPLPKSFRQYDLQSTSYHVYALVRAVVAQPAGHRVGVMFLGKNPPKGYEENRGGRYLMPTDAKPAPKERRAHKRYDMFLNLKLKREDSAGAGPAEEQTVAENVSKKGARVMTSLQVAKGDFIIVEELGGTFRARAQIRSVFIGKDNIPRLNIEFLDVEVPDRIIAAS